MRNEDTFKALMEARARFRELNDVNLRMVFDYMDVSGDGSISVAEFTGAFRKANVYVAAGWWGVIVVTAGCGMFRIFVWLE